MLLLIFLCKPIYFRILFYWATKLWALGINKFENVHYWKKEKNHSKTTVSFFILEQFFFNCSGPNSMPENVVHYLNMKMIDIIVEIIDLKLCSSLTWDGV